MVKLAHSSGKPAYAAGQGNSTMVIDEAADIFEAAHNSMLSKMSDFGSGCSADGNLSVEAPINNVFLEQLQEEGGYLVSEKEKQKLLSVLWQDGHRTIDTIACATGIIAEKAGFTIPDLKKLLIVKEENIGKNYRFSTKKLGTLLSLFKYRGFDVPMINNAVSTTDHWNILDIYYPGKHISHVSTD